MFESILLHEAKHRGFWHIQAGNAKHPLDFFQFFREKIYPLQEKEANMSKNVISNYLETH